VSPCPPAAEDREWALRRALQQINMEIEKASRNSVAIWFPMGNSNLRVVRLAPRESRLLNSRCGTGGTGSCVPFVVAAGGSSAGRGCAWLSAKGRLPPCAPADVPAGIATACSSAAGKRRPSLCVWKCWMSRRQQ
jgi:hypothetical protein